jgi:hypothetical protein
VLSAFSIAGCGNGASNGTGGNGGDGGIGGTPLPTVLDVSFSLDTAAATSAVIDANGGLVRVVGNDAEYSLAFPAGVLTEATQVTLTPLLDMLASGGEAIAGVQMAPSGLDLTVPATLTMTVATAQEPGLIGVLTDDAGRAVDLVPVNVTGTTLELPISHFSAAVAVKLSCQEARIADAQWARTLDFPPQATARINIRYRAAYCMMAETGAWTDEYFYEYLGTEVCSVFADWYTAPADRGGLLAFILSETDCVELLSRGANERIALLEIGESLGSRLLQCSLPLPGSVCGYDGKSTCSHPSDVVFVSWKDLYHVALKRFETLDAACSNGQVTDDELIECIGWTAKLDDLAPLESLADESVLLETAMADAKECGIRYLQTDPEAVFLCGGQDVELKFTGLDKDRNPVPVPSNVRFMLEVADGTSERIMDLYSWPETLDPLVVGAWGGEATVKLKALADGLVEVATGETHVTIDPICGRYNVSSTVTELCSGEVYVYAEQYPVNVLPTGNPNSYLWNTAFAADVPVSVVGNQLSWSASYPDEGGTTAEEFSGTFVEPGFSGTSSWVWTGSKGQICTGDSTFAGLRECLRCR